MLFGIGLLGEYVGRIYEQVRQRPRYLIQAVLEREETDWNAASERTAAPTALHACVQMTSAVVFAYHNVGVRCLSVLLAHGVEVPLVVTHRDAPGETIWFDSVAALAAAQRHRVRHAR